MAAQKSSSSAGNKKTSASKKAKSTADIQPKKKAAASAAGKAPSVAVKAPSAATGVARVPENTFTIKQLDYGAPQIEPLVDDISELEEEMEELERGGAENLDISYEPMRKPVMRVAEVSDLDEVDSMDDVPGNARVSNLEDIPPKDIIKVRFGTFVNLVSNHDMEEVVAENAEKEIIMEANLLTELAGSRDQREEKKIPLVFLVGIAIGVVLTYIFFST